MMFDELTCCPFCGYENTKVRSNKKLAGFTGTERRVEKHSKYGYCPKCYARGGIATGLVICNPDIGYDLPKWATTDEEIEKRAIRNWNKNIEENASQFVDDLIRYIAESVEEEDDDLSVEFVCRRLRKYDLIDVDGDRYILTYEGKDDERNIK